MKRLPVVPHLSYDEIDRRYRGRSDAAEKTRWQVLWLVTRPDQLGHQGRRAGRVHPVLGAGHPQAVQRPRARRPGRPRRDNGADPKLSPAQQVQLLDALRVPPPDHGLWSGPKVAAYVRDRFGVEVRNQTGWQWLRNLGFRLVVPRPRHPKAATPEQQKEWL